MYFKGKRVRNSDKYMVMVNYGLICFKQSIGMYTETQNCLQLAKVYNSLQQLYIQIRLDFTG